MLRRNLRHMQRYPSLTVMLVGIPVVFLLLFVYVLGGTLDAGLGDASGGRAEYVEYIVPGILLIAVASASTGTAISVAMDMTEGIIDRLVDSSPRTRCRPQCAGSQRISLSLPSSRHCGDC